MFKYLSALSLPLRRALAIMCLLAVVSGACAASTSPVRFGRLAPFDADDKSVASIILDRQLYIRGGNFEGLVRNNPETDNFAPACRRVGFDSDWVPAYWQTWWFRLLAIVLAAALLLGGLFVWVNSLKRVQRKLAVLVAERTRALEESNAKLAALSNTDGLTGVTNRRGFDAALADAWALAARTGTPLALGMLDVDHFKRYNDTYGHQDGDQCLRAVAQLLAGQFRRAGDIVARYGGEEFALLLPVSNAEVALRLAEDACASIAALQLPHAGSSYGIVTVSIGVAALVPQPGDVALLLLREADAALYRSKQDGRNRVSMAFNVDTLESGVNV